MFYEAKISFLYFTFLTPHPEKKDEYFLPEQVWHAFEEPVPGSLSLWTALSWNLTENVGRLVVKLKEIVGGPRQIEKGGCPSLPACWREGN